MYQAQIGFDFIFYRESIAIATTNKAAPHAIHIALAPIFRTSGGYRVRTALQRARKAVAAAGLEPVEITPRKEGAASAVSIGIMHLAKGLEFRSVVVMACDDEIIPLQSRIETVTDDTDLEEVYNTERHLLYVACTSARGSLACHGC